VDGLVLPRHQPLLAQVAHHLVHEQGVPLHLPLDPRTCQAAMPPRRHCRQPEASAGRPTGDLWGFTPQYGHVRSGSRRRSIRSFNSVPPRRPGSRPRGQSHTYHNLGRPTLLRRHGTVCSASCTRAPCTCSSRATISSTPGRPSPLRRRQATPRPSSGKEAVYSSVHGTNYFGGGVSQGGDPPPCHQSLPGSRSGVTDHSQLSVTGESLRGHVGLLVGVTSVGATTPLLDYSAWWSMGPLLIAAWWFWTRWIDLSVETTRAQRRWRHRG
jgi:hypothetical protein